MLRMLNRWKLLMNNVLDLNFKDHIVKSVLVHSPDIKDSASGLPIRPPSAEYRLRKLLFRTLRMYLHQLSYVSTAVSTCSEICSAFSSTKFIR